MSKASDTSEDIGKGVKRGLAWVGLASSMVGVLDILSYALIIAMGWISKEEFGVATIVMAFFPVLDLATDLGLAAAVIQKDDHSKEKISTVFWLNVAMSGVLFAALSLGLGPSMAHLHKSPIMAGLFTFYGFKLIWQNVYFIPYALMKKELRFKELSVIRVYANFAEFAAKIYFAWAGYGVWCFVAGPLCRVFITGIGVQIRNPWRPSLIFKFSEGWDWAKFGLRSSAHKIIFHLYNTVDYTVVGLFFGKAAAGVYGIAFKIVLEPALVISEVTANVAFPTFSKLKYQRDKLFEQLVSFCRMNLVIMLGFIGLIYVSAEEILALFSMKEGNDYSGGNSTIRILCAVAVLRALSFVIPPFLDGVGRPGLTLRYTVVASTVLSAFFFAFAHFLGPSIEFDSVALAWVVGYPIAFIYLVSMAFSILEMKSMELYRRLSGIAICALVATLGAGATKWATMGLPTVLRFGIVSAVMIAIFGTLLARFENISIKSIRASLSKS